MDGYILFIRTAGLRTEDALARALAYGVNLCYGTPPYRQQKRSQVDGMRLAGHRGDRREALVPRDTGFGFQCSVFSPAERKPHTQVFPS